MNKCTLRGKFNAAQVDSYFTSFLARDPEAYFLPRIGLEPPAWWVEKYPEEMILTTDGKRIGVSMASEKWRQDMGAQLERYVQHLAGAPYANHIMGLHFCAGTSAEWFARGLWEPNPGDYSDPMRQGFRDYLKIRYRSNDVMQKAWGCPDITFQTVELPTLPRRRPMGSDLIRNPNQFRDVIDYYTYYSDCTAESILNFARIIKRASHVRFLTCIFYGYLTQLGGFLSDSQHLASAKLLKSDDIDCYSSPAIYSGRGPGGTNNFMTAIDSIKLHNRLWIAEADIRTHLTPKPNVGVST